MRGSLFILLAAMSASASTTSYYVDSGRSSNGDGSQSNPWKLTTDVNWTTVTNALVSGGVTIYYSSRSSWQNSGYTEVKATGASDGATFTNWVSIIGDELYNTNASGTAVWTSETTTNRATFQTSGGNGGNIAVLDNHAYILIKGFYEPSPANEGILWGDHNPTTNMHDLKVLNCIIDRPTASTAHGIWFGYAETNCYNIQVSNCFVRGTSLEGIYMGHFSWLSNTITGVVIEYNTVIDCGTNSAGTSEGDIDIKPGCYGAIIRYNTHTNSSSTLTGGNCGVVIGADNCQVYGNIFARARRHSSGDTDWGYGIFANSDGDATSGHAVTSLLIYNNLIYLCANSGIKLISTKGTGTDLSGVKMWNNTIVGNNAYGVLASASGGRTVTIDSFENNILVGNTNEEVNVASGGVLTAADYNLYFRASGNSWLVPTTKTWAQWQALGYDAHGLNADPLLNLDYTLSASSPARSAGKNLSANFTTDILGHPRTQWDIGAFEFAHQNIITGGSVLRNAVLQ